MDEIYNPDNDVERYTIGDDCTVMIRCRCPKCSKHFSTDHERFYPQDIGEGQYFNGYHAMCPHCGEPILVVAPEFY